MKRRARKRSGQRGMALIVLATVLVLGIAWFAVGTLGRAPVAAAERETRTGLALQAAKRALLAYVAQQAARATTAVPGQMPCPEAVTLTNPGQASTSCSNAAASVGRLPWRTLGIDQPRDGDGEPLWYILSPGFRSAPINFGTPAQLTYNGATNAAVALIIAPGKPLAPSGCNTVNQQVATRKQPSLDSANFLECSNATGSYVSPGTTDMNDRIIAITAAEWADAIAPALADRLQRQIAPLLANWDTTEQSSAGKSWGSTWGLAYLPFASAFGNPATNDFCGNGETSPATMEGLPPIATRSSAACDTAWTGTASPGVPILESQGCTPGATEMVCTFRRKPGGVGGIVTLPATITVAAARAPGSFRGTILASDISVTNGGSASITGWSFSTNPGSATATIVINWPLLPVNTQMEVRIPNLADAAILTSSTLGWFLTSEWHRYTYYAIAPGAAAGASPACGAGGACLTVNGLAANSTNTRLVLVLSGRAPLVVGPPPSSLDYYLEADNLSTGDSTFVSAVTTSNFNDRVAACPFQHSTTTGAVAVCN